MFEVLRRWLAGDDYKATGWPGIPKSMDVSKAADKAAGAEREVVGSKIGKPGYR